ncbi:hypothetical protein ACLOJK_039098 [Asimina triloba]
MLDGVTCEQGGRMQMGFAGWRAGRWRVEADGCNCLGVNGLPAGRTLEVDRADGRKCAWTADRCSSEKTSDERLLPVAVRGVRQRDRLQSRRI